MVTDSERGGAEGRRCASHNMLGMRCERPQGHLYLHGATVEGVSYAWSNPPPDTNDADLGLPRLKLTHAAVRRDGTPLCTRLRAVQGVGFDSGRRIAPRRRRARARAGFARGARGRPAMVTGSALPRWPVRAAGEATVLDGGADAPHRDRAEGDAAAVAGLLRVTSRDGLRWGRRSAGAAREATVRRGRAGALDRQATGDNRAGGAFLAAGACGVGIRRWPGRSPVVGARGAQEHRDRGDEGEDRDWALSRGVGHGRARWCCSGMGELGEWVPPWSPPRALHRARQRGRAEGDAASMPQAAGCGGNADSGAGAMYGNPAARRRVARGIRVSRCAETTDELSAGGRGALETLAGHGRHASTLGLA